MRGDCVYSTPTRTRTSAGAQRTLNVRCVNMKILRRTGMFITNVYVCILALRANGETRPTRDNNVIRTRKISPTVV